MGNRERDELVGPSTAAPISSEKAGEFPAVHHHALTVAHIRATLRLQSSSTGDADQRRAARQRMLGHVAARFARGFENRRPLATVDRVGEPVALAFGALLVPLAGERRRFGCRTRVERSPNPTT